MKYGKKARAKSVWTVNMLIIFLLAFTIQGFTFTSNADSMSASHDGPINSIQVPRPQDNLATYSTSQFENTTVPNLSLESTLSKFVQTNWNEKTNESVWLEKNNDTIIWPEPIATEQRVQPPTEDLNSTKQETSQSRTMGESPGTTIFDDNCGSTVGWNALSSWGGDPLLSEIQDGIDLLVDNERFKSDDIPYSGSYIHGPMFIQNLTYPAAVGEGLNLEVRLEHEDVSSKMGVMGVAIYDMYGDIIFRIWINDAWYGPRSDVWVAYYFLDWQGGGYQTHSVEMDGSWSSTIKIWYDKESDSVKATVPRATITLVTDPSEAELDRFVKTVAIYFGRYLGYSFKTSFIDSIYIDVETDPTTGVPATPLTPAMDGHWFPKAGYSRLYFEINQPYSDAGFNLRIDVEADQDDIDRFFSVKVDGYTFYDEVISHEYGYDGVIPVPLVGTHKVELQIYWGGNVEKGWILNHFSPERFNGDPLEVVSEYFPQASTARLTYQAQLGEDTLINLRLEADQDPIGRITRVYVDGQMKYERSGDNAWELLLGDYADDSLHEIMIELVWGGYAEWGKKLTINRVHHLGGSVEIDYMTGHAPTQNDLDVLEAYYINMGYHRAEFYIDDLMTFVYEFNISTDEGYPSQQYWDYNNTYRDNYGDPKWTWMLWLHYYSWKGVRSESWGLNWGDLGIFMQDQVMIGWSWLIPLSASRRTVALHEYGHQINIIDRWPSNIERYCVNNYCAMAKLFLNAVYYPWYCRHHWSLHRFPGW